MESPFERLTILEAIKKYNPHYTDEQLNDAEWLKKEIVKHGESLPPSPGIGSLQLALFEGCAEGKLWNPTFVVARVFLRHLRFEAFGLVFGVVQLGIAVCQFATDNEQFETFRSGLFFVSEARANGETSTG